MDLVPVIDKLKKHHYFYLVITWYFCLGNYTDYIVSTIDNYRLITVIIMMMPIILIYIGNDDGVILFFLGILLSVIPHSPFNNLLKYFLLSVTCCLFIDLWLYALMKTFWINTHTTIGGKYIELWNIVDFALMCVIYLTITYLIINVISPYLSQYQTVTTIPTMVKFLLGNKEFIGLSIVLSRVYNHRIFLAKID